MEIMSAIPVLPSVTSAEGAPLSLQGGSPDASGFGALFQQLTASFGFGTSQGSEIASQDANTLLAMVPAGTNTLLDPTVMLSPEENAAFRALLQPGLAQSQEKFPEIEESETPDPLLALQTILAQIQQIIALLQTENPELSGSNDESSGENELSAQSSQDVSLALQELSAKLDEILSGLTLPNDQNPVEDGVISQPAQANDPLLLNVQGQLSQESQQLLKKVETVIASLSKPEQKAAQQVPLAVMPTQQKKNEKATTEIAQQTSIPKSAEISAQAPVASTSKDEIPEESLSKNVSDHKSEIISPEHMPKDVETSQGKMRFQEVNTSQDSSITSVFESKNASTEAKSILPQSNQAERIQTIQDMRPLHQVAAKVQFLMANGEGKATLRLDPPELGRIEIQIDTKPGELKVHMTVENQSVKDMMDSSISKLRESLELQNIKVERLEVQVESGRSNLQNNERDAQRKGQKNGNSHRGMRFADVSLVPATNDTGRRLGYNTMELIA